MSGKLEEGIKKGLLAGLGLAAITKEKAQQIARELIKKGETSSKNMGVVTSTIIEKAKNSKKILESKMEGIIKKIVERMDVPTRKEVQELKNMISELKKKHSKFK